MRSALSSVLVLLAATACSSSGNNTSTQDASTATDLGYPATDQPSASDAPRADAGRIDAGRDAGVAQDLGPSTAGRSCSDDGGVGCGTVLTCQDYVPGGFCSGDCTDNPSQANEQMQCGGTGSTCLTFNDSPNDFSICTRTCVPTARAGTPNACPAGQICTGWWDTHMDLQPDVTGCDRFCANDSQCAPPDHCNPRTGECGAALDMTLRADGEPCDPTITSGTPATNHQCRGFCYQIGDNANQGQCGSMINLGVTTACPDSPSVIQVDSATSDTGEVLDNEGVCLFKLCTTNADCTAPLTCVAGTGGDPSMCGY